MKLLSLLDVEKQNDRTQKRLYMERVFLEDPTSTPLHVAALLGDLDLTKELLIQSPELAERVKPGDSSALHLASAKGYAEIVKELVKANRDVCSVLDGDGLSPLHLAAIKGRVGVLTELIRVNSDAARVPTANGETCFHLCVKYNRLEAFKALMEAEGADKFLNRKDEFGNTILHLAVAKKQLEIIKYLLTNTAVEATTRNANGYTALDLLSLGPRDIRDVDIKNALITHTRCTNTLVKCRPNQDIPEQREMHKPDTDWLSRKRSSLVIVASLIATVAFQAALSPPGGVWPDEYLVDENGNPVPNPHEVGKSVLAYTIPKAYGQFMIFNTIAFLSSLSIILLQVSGLPIKRKRWMWTQMGTMWIAMSAQTATYFIAFVQLTPDRNNDGVLRQVTKIAVLGWMSVMGLVFIGNVVRVVRYLIGKYYRNVKGTDTEARLLEPEPPLMNIVDA